MSWRDLRSCIGFDFEGNDGSDWFLDNPSAELLVEAVCVSEPFTDATKLIVTSSLSAVEALALVLVLKLAGEATSVATVSDDPVDPGSMVENCTRLGKLFFPALSMKRIARMLPIAERCFLPAAKVNKLLLPRKTDLL